MNLRALGLLALLLLNQLAEAQHVALTNLHDELQDSAMETAEVVYAPIVNQSAEWMVQPFRGFLLPHHSDMMSMYKHVTGIGFRYRAAMKATEGLGRFSDKLTYGYTLNLMDLGSEVAGYGAGAGALLMAQSGRKGYFLFGMGLGYLSQKFDAIENPRNIAIGSNMNGTMQLGYHLELASNQKYRNRIFLANLVNEKVTGTEKHRSQLVSSLWKLNLELGMMHFSNANWSQPNFGINLPYLAVGLKKSLVHSYFRPYNDKQRVGVYRTEISDLQECSNRGWKNPSTYELSVAPRNTGWSHSVGFRAGRRQIELDERQTFVNTLLEYVAEYETGNRGHRWRYGGNVFFDKSYLYTKFGKGVEVFGLRDYTEVALTLGHRWQFGRWGILADAGFYLYRPKKTKRAYYEGVGVSYGLSPKVQLIARLKAHLSMADYMEWGINYTL